jgi:hypothetical protein
MSYKRPKFKSGNKSFIAALNAVLQFAEKHGINPGGRPGWVETEKGWMPPYIKATSEFGGSVWTLNVINAETMEVSVNCGTVIEDVVDLTAHVAIVDGSETFTVAAGDMLWLKLEYNSLTFVTTVTLESGDTWGGYPKCFESTGSGGTAEWVATYYPLYKFLATATSETSPVAEGLHALKLVGDTHFAIANVIYQNSTNRPISGITLVPYHRAIP